MRHLSTSLVALALLAACGGGTAPRRAAVDTECVQGMPFASAAASLYAKYEPQLSQLSDRLSSAHTLEDDQAVLALVAQVLGEQEADLQALKPPGDDATLVAALAAADERMRAAAESMSHADAATMSGLRSGFTAAAQSRADAARALELRAEFVQGECGS